MADDKTIAELREEVRRLREGQEKLLERTPGNGHPPAETPPTQNQGEQNEKRPPDRRSFFTRHRTALMISGIVAIAIAIGAYFLLGYFHSSESTDDAQVDGHLNPISSRIAGTVTAVYVEENQFVQSRQVLAELDPRDYQTALDQARAAYDQALSQVQAANPGVPIAETTTQTAISAAQAQIATAQAAVAAAQQDYNAKLAEIQQAEAQNNKAQADLKRYQSLIAKDEISKQEYDAAVAAAQSQAATVAAAKASADAAQKLLAQRRAQLAETQTRLVEAQRNAPHQVAVSRADVVTRQANAEAAKARLELAQLNLSYTKIIAPVSGVVTSRTAQLGQHVQASEQLLSIAQIDNVWITANFKETQLARMHPGQSADIGVDAFGTTLKGYIQAMPGASGAATSLLPPENATGNFVKVVQRLPVRIALKPGQDSQHRLRIGMSVEAKVLLQ
ncbi:MAG: HlyD family secretion protein [Bryobacteraceae bacterium]